MSRTELRSWGDPDLAPSNARESVTVTEADLPLHCPMPGTTLWNSHPRVFLPIERTGESLCPYCSTHFVLKRD